MESAFLFSHDHEQFFYRGQAMKTHRAGSPKDDHANPICPGLKKKPKGEIMSSKNNTRVLNRMGARKLSGEDMEKVVGGDHVTLLSAILTGAGNGQGHDVRSDT
jgi:hypothetical protein